MDDRTITVHGLGRVARPADRAEVRLGVQVTRATATEARRDGATAMTAVLAALGEAGIGSDDVRTVQLALQPAYEHDRDGGSRVVGHQVTNEVVATVRRLDDVGRVIDDAIAAGATIIESVSFRVGDEATLRRGALEAAVADARAKAEVLAVAAGVALGSVLSVGEETDRSGPPAPFMAMRMEAADDTPMVPGAVEVVARVAVVFGLAPA